MLPRIMVAPNGARRGKADHPALPISVSETVNTAARCHAAGADALHAHVRDADGAHVLDAGLYRELLAEMDRAVPSMPVQITTEAVGRYSPQQQRRLVWDVEPEGVSVALREMWPEDGRDAEAATFYNDASVAGIAVQHILYSPDDVARLADFVSRGWIAKPAQLLFVLGRYNPPRLGHPNDLGAFRAALGPLADCQWAVCAFGRNEQACLLEAAGNGGCMRIGFENNIELGDGRPSISNDDQVRRLMRALEDLKPVASLPS
ncbi:3-keto-5-aminohexanoate cleavage protein [Pontivivens insulae]|uniref:3-keto-5-aminohexanoate cleavage enzyme n=1 Tax=Pontivivens insulae TaxID=1639689 RepID=A0A2R8AFY1_9RHOB|nr:3-keto-5-aminohexanoate cleavage protein [Pontivivens insulae]RED12209.1 uncharacterized protein (DUF849 family) [Pontivivens insulae]SPF30965.1 3-keto-5-aminohexanoate cleavage enzyme [Pontivivens insulae]